MHISTIPPIVIDERKQPSSDIFVNVDLLHRSIREAAEKVLEIMLENKMTLVPERKAVWMKSILATDSPSASSFAVNKVGESFPDKQFGDNCRVICAEKATRTTEDYEHLCSHESREPKKGKWGGSIKMLFELVHTSGIKEMVICLIAPSGLKEWEDLALGLGALYYLGLIKFEDAQVQEILRRVEESVKGQPEFQPEGMSITEYVKNLFDTIDQQQEESNIMECWVSMPSC